jgi:VanZ family protein
MNRPQAPRRVAQIAAAFFGLVVIYGSLYPFQFASGLTPGDALLVFSDTWRTPADPYDLVANALFYIPVGFCLSRALPLPWLLQCTATLFFGAALSFSLEMAQFYVAGRVPSLWDLAGNSAGTILGTSVGFALLHGKKWPLVGSLATRPYVGLLLVSWSAFFLCPSTQGAGILQSWITPTKLPDGQPAWLAIYAELVTALALALLLEEIAGRRWRRMAILYFASAFLLVRLLLSTHSLPSSDMIGAALGVLLWVTLLWKMSIRASVVAALYLGSVASERLQPFRFTAPGQTFHWIPLLGLITAPPQTAIFFSLHKLFTLGALLWLLARARLRLETAAWVGCLLLSVLLASECFISDKWAEISDLLLLVGCALLMKLSGESTLLDRESS